jgi:hypothetical protein
LVLPEAKVTEIMTKVEAILGEELKVPGKKFLEENKKKEGVVTLQMAFNTRLLKKVTEPLQLIHKP